MIDFIWYVKSLLFGGKCGYLLSASLLLYSIYFSIAFRPEKILSEKITTNEFSSINFQHKDSFNSLHVPISQLEPTQKSLQTKNNRPETLEHVPANSQNSSKYFALFMCQNKIYLRMKTIFWIVLFFIWIQ